MDEKDRDPPSIRMALTNLVLQSLEGMLHAPRGRQRSTHGCDRPPASLAGARARPDTRRAPACTPRWSRPERTARPHAQHGQG